MPDGSANAIPTRKHRLPRWAWVLLIATIIYDISPIDLIPEGILGPFGFADDVALTTVVLAFLGWKFGRPQKNVASTTVTIPGTATRDVS
jgi:uncharacterized membrane protein YkvA (DUF1232 family)